MYFQLAVQVRIFPYMYDFCGPPLEAAFFYFRLQNATIVNLNAFIIVRKLENHRYF